MSGPGRRSAVLDVGLRPLLRLVLLDVLLNLPADVRTGRGAGRGRNVLVADVLADRAADGRAERGARDRVLVGLGAIRRDFLVPAVLCGGRGRDGLRVLRRRMRRFRGGLLDRRAAWLVGALAEELIRGDSAGRRDTDARDQADEHRLVAHFGSLLKIQADTLPKRPP